jgi:hypothetical protein
MARSILTLAAVGGVALMAAACQPAAEEPAETTTVVETPTPAPVVVEQPAPVVVEAPTSPPVVVEREGDSTTVRAGRDGIEVETTNR